MERSCGEIFPLRSEIVYMGVTLVLATFNVL